MKNNPILDVNLKQIARYNPELRDKIMKIEHLTQDIQFSNTALQEANLNYNGIPLHDLVGAELEAKIVFSKVENTPVMMHVVFGFGLGYLFQQFALKSKGIVLVYEPSLEILASTLEVADLSNELSKQNVFVFNNFNKLISAYQNLRIENSSTTISFLPSYNKIFNPELKMFAEKVNQVMGQAILNENYFKTKLRPAVKIVCENIPQIIKEPPLLEFRNIYKDKTAVVVSAGPSLDKNVETLKKYKDNVLIIAVLQALKTLTKNGINPDFIVSIEQCDSTPQLNGVDTKDSYLILEPLTHPAMHKVNFKRKFSYPSCTSIANNVWANYANMDNSQYISSGTVSYTALYSAMFLGCKDIILVGQDLAFCGGKCYSNGTNRALVYQENPSTGKVEVVVEKGQEENLKEALYGKTNLSEEERNKRLERYLTDINSKLNYVEGIKGNKLPTTVDYATFISQFEDFAQIYGNRLNLYNTSMEGAKINGFKDIPLEELLKDSKHVEKVQLDKQFSYDVSKIQNSIKQEIQILKEVQTLMEKASRLIVSFEKEFAKNNNELNSQAGAYFKQLMILYIDMPESYSGKSLIYNYEHKASSSKISYNLRTNKLVDPKSIVLLFNDLKKYFTENLKEYNLLIKILEKKVEELNEMLDSKG